MNIYGISIPDEMVRHVILHAPEFAKTIADGVRELRQSVAERLNPHRQPVGSVTPLTENETAQLLESIRTLPAAPINLGPGIVSFRSLMGWLTDVGDMAAAFVHSGSNVSDSFRAQVYRVGATQSASALTRLKAEEFLKNDLDSHPSTLASPTALTLFDFKPEARDGAVTTGIVDYQGLRDVHGAKFDLYGRILCAVRSDNWAMELRYESQPKAHFDDRLWLPMLNEALSSFANVAVRPRLG
jgi:hypothetical protein